MLGNRSGSRPARLGPGERPTVVRASTARALPPLRPVPDFVALQDGSRSVSSDTAFLVAGAAALGAVLTGSLLGVATGAAVASLVTWPYAVVLAVAAIGLPAGRAVFRALALALDHPTPVQQVRPRTPVTVVVSGASDATVASLRAQDYGGPTGVVTAGGTIRPVTPLTLVVDAGVVLHPSALRLLVARLASSPDTVAVAAHSLVLATNAGITAEGSAAAWTDDLDAAQRTEALFAGPLAADSACTLIRTDALAAVPGWAMPGSRAAMTWRLLERGVRVAHEPLAIVFVPQHATVTTTARGHAARVRAVRAAGAANAVSALPRASSRWLARLDLRAPLLDGVVALSWAQAIALAVLGHVSLLFLVVLTLPLALVPVLLERRRHAATLEEAGLMLVAPAVWTSYLAGFDGVRAVLWVATLRDVSPRRSAPPSVPETPPAPVHATPLPAPPPVSWPAPAPAVVPAAPRPPRARRLRRVRLLGRRARPYA